MTRMIQCKMELRVGSEPATSPHTRSQVCMRAMSQTSPDDPMTLQVYLGQGIDSLLEVVDTLQLTVESFSKQMISMQRDMYEC